MYRAYISEVCFKTIEKIHTSTSSVPVKTDFQTRGKLD